jgi:hypothetical protein
MSSSIELEWVSFSGTPNSASFSMTSRDFTSSCRANSLIRILLIFKRSIYLPARPHRDPGRKNLKSIHQTQVQVSTSFPDG